MGEDISLPNVSRSVPGAKLRVRRLQSARGREVVMIIRETQLLTYGIALGAGVMFLLDPRQGGARRALIRDKSLRALHEVEGAAAVGSRDMAHRVEGMVARVRGVGRRDEVDDDVLVARVRAKLGHLCSHPHAIQVSAKGNGCIELKGPILAKEVDEVLSAIAHVPGVRVIDDDLERHRHADDVPALQGEPVRRPVLARLWTPAVRLVLGAGAAGLALASLVRGNVVGLLAGGGSMLAIARSSTRGNPHPFLRHARTAEPALGPRVAEPM
jgi:hypothetical protein